MKRLVITGCIAILVGCGSNGNSPITISSTDNVPVVEVDADDRRQLRDRADLPQRLNIQSVTSKLDVSSTDGRDLPFLLITFAYKTILLSNNKAALALYR